MRILPPAVAAHLAARRPLLVHALAWIAARDRTTRAEAPIGIWTGADHEVISIGGAARTYYGAGAMLGLDDFTARAELEVREWSMQVSPLHDQIVEAIRLYDARLARFELHLWYFDPTTMTPLADPVREFRGVVTTLDIHTPEIGGEASATLRCASDAWALTRGLPLKRSQAALSARVPGDQFRKYNAISGSVATAWGENVKADPATVPPKAYSSGEYGGDWK